MQKQRVRTQTWRCPRGAGQEVKFRFGSCRARSRRSACQWTGGWWRACARGVGEEIWRL